VDRKVKMMVSRREGGFHMCIMQEAVEQSSKSDRKLNSEVEDDEEEDEEEEEEEGTRTGTG
jgi:hypothetical protein